MATLTNLLCGYALYYVNDYCGQIIPFGDPIENPEEIDWDWLEAQSLEWDMYVDLSENMIKYCFRTMADAITFKRRFGDAAEGRAIASAH